MSNAQESVNASGGNAAGTGGSVSFSVGQVVYRSFSGTGGTMAEGVQQAYEIFPVSLEEDLPAFHLSVFPNPTNNQLTLQVDPKQQKGLSYKLFDAQGKLLISGPVVSDKTEINASALPPATYFVQVDDAANKKIQSFKIIKK